MTGRENLEMVARLFGLDRADGARRPRRACSRSSASTTRATGSCAPTPAACAAGSTSAPASSVRRACCCSTSRPPGSTPAAASSCGTRSASLVANGTDVLLTTQYLDEADQLAARIVIVDHGRVDRRGHARRAEAPGRARTSIEVARPPTATTSRRSPALGARPGPSRRSTRPRAGSSIGVDGTGDLTSRRGARMLDGPASRRRHRAAPTDARRGLPRPDRPDPRTATAAQRGRPGDAGPTTCTTNDADGTTSTTPYHRRATRHDAASRARRSSRGAPCRKFVRTPQLVVVGTIQGAMFLLIFRYVFGGAIDARRRSPTSTSSCPASSPPSSCSPAWARRRRGRGHGAGLLRPAAVAARSRGRRSWPAGRWPTPSCSRGASPSRSRRLRGRVPPPRPACSTGWPRFGLCVVFGFAFEWVFIALGLFAGNAQAAQGMACSCSR